MMNPEVYEYDVFLSFRGPDTRESFVDVLYYHMDRAGIRVFRDDDELEIGDRIDDILLAIKNSEICVPVFSKTFAESKWCLMEVREMDKLGKAVVPVFYKVTPDDVGLKTEVYTKFMPKHEEKYGEEQVKQWKESLKATTKLKGREYDNTSYTKFCVSFVEELLIKLKPRKIFDLDNLVGMDNPVDSAIKLVNIGSDGVRYILIHGMGGIGKTTLAKVIFDKVSASFDGCSLMENVRESSKREGLDSLQKKLGDSLDPKPAAASNICRDIRERFRGKKVLIILDDVDAAEQVEELVGKSSFASGSRIIITTRNANVLNECEDLDEDLSVQSLEMGTLQKDVALQLFKIYAFRNDSPPASIFEKLSNEAISTAGGLPLAIKVIASLLRGKSERVWRDVIARSKNIPLREVKDRLKISYDALEEEQKQIFLDIACFFIDVENSYANYMWEACDLNPTYGLEVLTSMSLVKIKDDNAISMHDQLRDMGRDIVREENTSDPTKRSRIWLPEDAVKLLEGKRGGEKVEALSLCHPLKVSLTREQCAGFRNLRFLKLELKQCAGLWTELKCLLWRWCPSKFKASHSFSKNLVILDLSHSSIDGGWGPLIQMAVNLKVLNLTNCKNLRRTPDFSRNCSLELAEIDISIGNLRRLKFLDLMHCYQLQQLPELPPSLRKLVLSRSGIRSLPSTVDQLSLLEELDLTGCGQLQQLPELPPSLRKLELSGSGIRSLPSTVEQLSLLEELELTDCYQLQQLPELPPSLRKLVLSRSGIRSLPSTVDQLSLLEELDLRGCRQLQQLVGLPPSLRELELSGSGIHSLPSTVDQLPLVEELELTNCHQLQQFQELQSFTNLKKLELRFSNHATTKLLFFSLLTKLERLELAFKPLTSAPSSLGQLSGDTVEVELPRLSKMKNLSYVTFTNLWMEDGGLVDNLGVEELERLGRVEIANCSGKLTEAMCLAKSLRDLSIWYCRSLPDLSHLSALSKLAVRGCREITHISGIEELESLSCLSICDCGSLERLGNISKLKELSDLTLWDCPALTCIEGIEEGLRLEYLSIRRCGSPQNVDALLRRSKTGEHDWRRYKDGIEE